MGGGGGEWVWKWVRAFGCGKRRGRVGVMGGDDVAVDIAEGRMLEGETITKWFVSDIFVESAKETGE